MASVRPSVLVLRGVALSLGNNCLELVGNDITNPEFVELFSWALHDIAQSARATAVAERAPAATYRR